MLRWSHNAFRIGLLLVCASVACATPTVAAPTTTARACLALAEQAADSWADDARLVWVENDAPVDADGRAAAWGFLFWSPAHGAMRSWSVRDGTITVAEDHTVTAAAPGVETWIDSDAIVRGARSRALETCETGCSLETLLLVRGVFDKGTAWVAVFSTPEGPSLYIVCDAANGRILRNWRG